MKTRRMILFLLLFLPARSIFAMPCYQPDLNGDRFVDFADFGELARNWQKSGSGLIGDLDDSGNVDEIDLMRFVYYWLSEFEWKSADFNSDGIVDFPDFVTFADAWLASAGEENWNADCDFNNDEVIDFSDLDRFTEQWLQYPLVIFVDANAAPGGDGTSWNTAFMFLQDAISEANEGFHIWVAQGIYLPDANSDFPMGLGMRTTTFQIPQGVSLYGGFPTGGGRLNQRNWINNQTILSGDICTAGERDDNCYNVVTGANDVVLDGFIIADGNATATGNNARGGGMRNEDVHNMTVANCIFRDNYAKYDGGAIYNYQSSISFNNCSFNENNCGDDGGGVYNSNTDAILINCSFFDNLSSNRGGGIYNYESPAELVNCLFNTNHAGANGGAVYNGYRAVKLINCTISENSAGGNTGGVYNSYSSSVLTNCIVWDNGIEIYKHHSTPHILYSDVKDCGTSGAGWNENYGEDDGNNIDANPCFAGDLSLEAGSLCIDAGKNFALPLDITTDINSNARFNGIVDMGAYEYGNLNMEQDTDEDGMPDWWEFRFYLDINDANDALDDLDEDGLLNSDEYNNNCDALFFDTDGDLLPDGWEVMYSLDPRLSDIIAVVDGNNIYADSDNDGLDTLAEIVYGTSPAALDTDSDGVSDGIEVSQGSLPNDGSDLGLPPGPEQICELRLTVGDWSNSNSERYDLKVGSITHQATKFGVVATADYEQFRPGNRYEVRVVHRGTDPSKWYYPNADYDYVAQIEAVSLPAGVVMQLEDADGILGYHGDSNTPNHVFDAEGKVAYVDLIKVQITEPDGNPAADNHFVFDSSSSGVCDVIATGTTGISQKDSDLEWLLTAISGSVQTSNPNPPKGPDITFTYTGLPVSNSEFGIKTLTLTHPPTSQQDTKQVEIFFSRDAYNHSGAGSGTTRNWFYYWKEGLVVSDIAQFGYQDENGYGVYYPATGELFVRNDAPTSDNYQVTFTNQYYITSINSGPDGIADTTAVEDDVQVIPVGQGEPNQTAISAGTNGILDTNAVGDDVKVGTIITTGSNGICDTAVSGDDVQVIPVGQGKPYSTIITAGADNFMHSADSVSGQILVSNYDNWDISNAQTVFHSVNFSGIDCCADTCSHELEHKRHHDTGGIDTDGDGLPDSLENGIYHLDPGRRDTYDIEHAIAPGYWSYGDSEFLARLAETNPGPRYPNNDWSDTNGKQWSN